MGAALPCVDGARGIFWGAALPASPNFCLLAKEMGKDQDCSLPVEEAGIIWDSICFFFLLLQRRVFLSYYFLHVMLDLQASALQASR